MAEQNLISKKRPSRHDLDYQWLREAGIVHLQKLAARIWTDYNIHDPGVSLLELLSYAITDLGYRCTYSVEDILSSDPENKIGDTPDFFKAKEILPAKPLGIFDYRKLLIDLPFVRNAWLEPEEKNEIDIYFDALKNELTYDSKNEEGKDNQLVPVKGLYQVWIEFARDEELGDLNSGDIVFPFEIKQGNKFYPAFATITFPSRDDVKSYWKAPLALSDAKAQLADSGSSLYDFDAQVKVTFAEVENPEVFNLQIGISSGSFDWKQKKAQVKKTVRDALKNIEEDGILPHFNKKNISIEQYLNAIHVFLQENRNLCEDFLSVDLIKTQEIALDAQVEISLDADPHDLLAKAFFDIHQFLDPSIRFYSLRELLDEGLSTEEIFDGPLLKHGFIKDENLKAFRQCKTLYVSDILNIFISSNPEQIKYLTGFMMSNYLDNTLISAADSNLLHLHNSDIYKPRLSILKSDIVCTKQEEIIPVSWEKVNKLFQAMILANEPDKSIPADMDLVLTIGRNRNISDYTSIQTELPPVYGVGEGTLTDSTPGERKALSRQLKGYLMFFDQLLTNFLAQLSNLKNILSMDDEVAQTYFEQAVYNTPGAMYLLRDFIGNQPDPDDKEALKQAWEDFKTNSSNDYITKLRNISEDEIVFKDRRNRFLDHLMARFNESFADYSLLMYAQNQQQIPQHLLPDKTAFLQNFPELSSGRAVAPAIAIPEPEVWDTDNVSGLKKMISHKIGFSDYSRRFLSAGPFGNVQFYQEKDIDIISEFRFRIINGEGKILLSSSKHYDVIDDGYEVVYRVIENGKNPEYFEILESSNHKFYFNLYDDDHNILARRIEMFETEEEAKDAIETVIAFMNDQFTGLDQEAEEGFFVLENLLLRPQLNEKVEGDLISDTLMPIVRDDFGNLTEEGTDPYSFRIFIVFPSSLEKFNDPAFKALVRRIARLETPAHIMPEIYFANNLQLSRFERAYKAWLELYVLPWPDDPTERKQHLQALSIALNELIGALQFVPEEPDL